MISARGHDDKSAGRVTPAKRGRGGRPPPSSLAASASLCVPLIAAASVGERSMTPADLSRIILIFYDGPRSRGNSRA